MTDVYVYGLHAVNALLNASLRKIKRLILNQDRNDERLKTLIDRAIQHQIPLETKPLSIINQQFPNQRHQGVIAVTSPLPQYSEQDLSFLLKACSTPAFILILDGITDPHNLGACLRTAEAAGVHFVIIPKDKNASITPVVAKVACGALEFMPLIRVTNLVRCIDHLKTEGIWVYGAAGEATQSFYALPCSGPIALIMGAEGEGLRRLTREHCDGLFSLPMAGSIESLNVSVATGISLYEVVRQRSLHFK